MAVCRYYCNHIFSVIFYFRPFKPHLPPEITKESKLQSCERKTNKFVLCKYDGHSLSCCVDIYSIFWHNPVERHGRFTKVYSG